MSISRREFLKIASASALLGFGGISAFEILQPGQFEASQVMPDSKGLVAKRWAMVVDISRFRTEEDYKRCIEACHRIHNVPDVGNLKEEIKWIWKETYEHAFPGQKDEFLSEKIKDLPFLVLCNHCNNPPCVRVCPTKATFKRESDGIVMMDMHRCIGCRFCMAACPYGARSFNFRDPRPFINEANKLPYDTVFTNGQDREALIKKGHLSFPTRMRGVVEKCTFCYERLAVGLQPACVEASQGGLIFGDLEVPNSEVRKVLNEKYSFRRKPELGTYPSVYYILG
ncbi:MAG: 4Fe-4S dicluster domain-containing protein [Nitrospirota bacterium]|jgi:molybdopterin-containing oxidoreductase family iron-sulfur binding subunit